MVARASARKCQPLKLAELGITCKGMGQNDEGTINDWSLTNRGYPADRLVFWQAEVPISCTKQREHEGGILVSRAASALRLGPAARLLAARCRIDAGEF